MEKVVRDGKVAVLISPGFGAGWFSWNTGIPACLFSPEIVGMIEEGRRDEVRKFAEEKWPEGYWGGSEDLAVEWVGEGEGFRVEEYDGNESLLLRSSDGWITA